MSLVLGLGSAGTSSRSGARAAGLVSVASILTTYSQVSIVLRHALVQALQADQQRADVASAGLVSAVSLVRRCWPDRAPELKHVAATWFS